MTFSTGTGGTVGGPATPTPQEMAATAWIQATNQELGIAKDTIAIPLTDLGRNAKWKYRSEARNPTIAPLNQTRMTSVNRDHPDDSWKEHFDLLLNFLPADIRDELFAQGLLSASERDSAYVALDKVLGDTAAMIAWLEVNSLPTGSFANIALIATALQGTINQGSQILTGVQDLLLERQNMPHFDRLLSVSNQLQVALGDLDDLSHPIGSNKQSLTLLASDLEGIKHQPGAHDIEILNSLANAMQVITAGLSLHHENAALMLGLNTSMIGISNTESAAGVLSPQLINLTHMLSDALIVALPHADSSVRQLLPMLLQTGLIAASTNATVSMITSDSFPLSLAMQIGITSGVYESIAKSLVLALGATDSTVGPATDILSLAAVWTMIQTASLRNPAAAIELVENLSVHLMNWLNSIESFVSESIAKGDLDSSKSREIGIYLQQAKISLFANDYESFIQTLGTISNPNIDAEGSEVNLKNQMKDLEKFIEIIRRYTLSPGEDARPVTGIVQA